MENTERYRKLGSEKEKDFNKDFDQIYDKYLKKAKDVDDKAELRFERERGRVLIFVKLFEYEK
jgi:ABC-type Zn uptake system ZnuABC Zn-binding protein ZnuA